MFPPPVDSDDPEPPDESPVSLPVGAAVVLDSAPVVGVVAVLVSGEVEELVVFVVDPPPSSPQPRHAPTTAAKEIILQRIDPIQSYL